MNAPVSNDFKNRVLELSTIFLDDQLNYGQLLSAARELNSLLQHISGGDFMSREMRKEVYKPNGKATTPFNAAMIVEDIVRTRQFMRGVYKAIGDKLSEGKESLHVLYAGTGPFATLLLPSLLRYPKEIIRYTFIEINPLTANLLRRVTDRLGLSEYSITVLECDASTMLLDPNTLPDVVLSETMQNLLAKEQQVSVFLNLMRQTPPETVFIPQSVEIYLGLMVNTATAEALSLSHFKKQSKVFELSRATLQPYLADTQAVETMGESHVELSAESQEGHESLLLLTEIGVYGTECILINQSGLTTPKIIKNIEGPKGNIRFTSRYRISEKPGLEFEISNVPPL